MLHKSESVVQREKIKELEAQGYYVIKLISTNKNGIPDLVALKPDEVKFFEIKAKGGKTSALQDYRMAELQKKGFDTCVVFGD